MSSTLAPLVETESWYNAAPGALGSLGGHDGNIIKSLTAAWCGAAFDYTNKTMHFAAHGGHSNGWNNQAFSITVPSGGWVQTKAQTSWPPDTHGTLPTGESYQPVNYDDGNPTAQTGLYNTTIVSPWMGTWNATQHFPPFMVGRIVYKDGAPASRHVYGGEIWLPTQQRMLMMSGGTVSGNGNQDSMVAWFDPTTGIWTHTHPVTGLTMSLPVTGLGIITAYDHVRDLVYWAKNLIVYAYNPATDQHWQLMSSGDPLAGTGGAPYGQMCVDGNCDYLYMTYANRSNNVRGGFPDLLPSLPTTYDNALVRLPLSGAELGAGHTRVSAPVKMTGSTVGVFGYPPGMEYDPDKKAFVFWALEDPNNLSIVRQADFHVYRVPIKGTPVSAQEIADNQGSPGTNSGVWGRFRRYDTHKYCLFTSASYPVRLITLA